jgi:hypothetical protein
LRRRDCQSGLDGSAGTVPIGAYSVVAGWIEEAKKLRRVVEY